MSNVVSHARLQFRFSWNLISCCVSRRHGQRSNVLAVFISLSGSKMRPCFAIGPELRTNEVRALQSSIRRDRRGCVSFEGFFVSTRSVKEVIPSKKYINLRSMKVFSSSLNKFRDSSGARTKYFSFAMYYKCTVCLARRRTASCLKMSQAC